MSDISNEENEQLSEEFYIVQPETFLNDSIVFAAKNGCVDAMYTMGIFFLGYYKCTPDHRKAFRWFKQAATYQHSEAVYKVAHCYENGIGTEIDTLKALRWYHAAAKMEHYLAEKKLALCYSAGKLNCYPDINNADKWRDRYLQNPKRAYYENKEKWEIPQELQEVGYTHESEIFSDESYLVSAIQWAVNEKNYINAKYTLALLYTSGFGGHDVLERNNARAIELLQEIIQETNDPASMYCLARLYEEGKGDTPQKLDMALKLYKEASRNGDEDAKQVLNNLKCMPMDDESRALKNEVNRYRQIEMIKENEQMDFKKRHSIKNKIRGTFRLINIKKTS